MLAVILGILSVLGIMLLTLLGVVIAVLLLVLFFPVFYDMAGSKDTDGIMARVRVNWLFGLLRGGYAYPEPGRLVVKLLFFTIFDSGAGEPGDSEAEKQKKPKKNKRQKKRKRRAKERNISAGSDYALKESEEETEHKKANAEGSNSGETVYQENKSDSGVMGRADAETDSQTDSRMEENPDYEGTGQPEETKAEKGSVRERLFAKFEKIKYTIRKIYDKIKDILENIFFYRGLLEEEDTKELFRHGCLRLGKMWKNVRPRKIKADILFGAASPDTTGYAYGIYSMISPGLGKHICVTPDFNRAVLEGRAEISGYITVFSILWNGMRLVLDKRLRLLIRKVKKHNSQAPAQKKNDDLKNNYAQGTT